jgi:hypothetical protein
MKLRAYECRETVSHSDSKERLDKGYVLRQRLHNLQSFCCVKIPPVGETALNMGVTTENLISGAERQTPQLLI